MKINGVGAENVINFYTRKNVNESTKKAVPTKDSIEISSAAKNLSSLKIDLPINQDDRKLQYIRNQVTNGTYTRDSKLVAQKIVDYIKGREV
ncbi:flagellar biosynthesis anti-sigma factor FlgM [Clostridium hydrogenum]|uniref:flagellar biosynthesis anti-sigma factor FlgM n=1 Tax=Clostridium hydrogenum TaxID=2855764 RepID=UPI001F359A7E|nr:flagellar biosynthesis anti-sigma factor FlgM [Clostridium hydrogenum]